MPEVLPGENKFICIRVKVLNLGVPHIIHSSREIRLWSVTFRRRLEVLHRERYHVIPIMVSFLSLVIPHMVYPS